MNQEREPTPRELLAVEFVGGVLLASTPRLGLNIRFSKYDPRLHKAMADAYQLLKARAPTEGLEPLFRISPHRIHGDSQTLASALEALVSGGELQFTDPSMRWYSLQVDEDFVTASLGRLPGSRGLYDELADVFVDSWQASVDVSH